MEFNDDEFDKMLDEQIKRSKVQKDMTEDFISEEKEGEQEEQTEVEIESKLKSDTETKFEFGFDSDSEIEDSEIETGEVSVTKDEEPEMDVVDSLKRSEGSTEFSFDSFSSASDLVEPDIAPPTKGKETILIAGDKNAGKSVAALSFPGKIAVIAFDEKIFSARDYVLKHGIKDEKDIMIYYPAKFYNPKAVDDREIGQAAIAVINEAFRDVYSIKVRAEADKFVPDWIFFDNMEFFIRLAEFAGKYKRGVPITTRPQEGDNVWGAFDIRNIITNVIYKTAIAISKKGVIYTLYTREKDVILPDGTTKKAQVPRWFEVLMYETDNHIIVWKDEDNARYFAKIVGTKDDEKYPDGLIIETTGRGFWKALNEKREKKNEINIV